MKIDFTRIDCRSTAIYTGNCLGNNYGAADEVDKRGDDVDQDKRHSNGLDNNDSILKLIVFRRGGMLYSF